LQPEGGPEIIAPFLDRGAWGVQVPHGNTADEAHPAPDNLIPKFLGLGVQYFHSTVGRLLQQSSEAYLRTSRK
jgi:hypothetical protein